LNVFPSEREGLPVNLMESLAMGVPVVTVNSRGCREVVRHEVDGIMLDDYKTSRLVQAMTDLQNDRAKLQRFSEASLQGRERFDRKYFIKDQFEIFARLTGKEV
jgi:glycosyltransferase involved in cell wall biosynthesis